MKKHHTTILLAILFFTGLLVLWWANDTGLEQGLSDAVLPVLDKVPQADIQRLEILKPSRDRDTEPSAAKQGASREGEKLVLERRPEGRWQMVEPIDVAADPSIAEALARNLREMRKSIDAGTLRDAPEKFGLAPPETIVRVFGSDAKTPLATLDVGKTLRELLYVRPGGGAGIDVVDPRLLTMLRLGPAEWRDKSLFHLPSFRVGTLSVNGPGRELTVERDEGHWQLVRPFRAVAEDDKVEGLVAELTSLRVAKGDAGFVAEGVKKEEAAKYGLDQPAMRIELRPAIGVGTPQTLDVGKPESEGSDLYYARAGGQDDVVLIDAKSFRDLGIDPNALRSKKVAEFQPARVEFIRVEAFGRTIDLARTSGGWEQVRPTREPADPTSVTRLLDRLAEAQTSEFLDPAAVSRSGMDPPWMTIKLWQAGSPAKPPVRAPEEPPRTEPRLALRVGSHDALRKMVYARLEGDRSLLAIPEALWDALPKNPLAFRDRAILTLGVTDFLRLAIRRDGTTYEVVAPDEPGKSVHWRMVAPVTAPADEESVTKVLMLLSNLHAEGFISDQVGDGKAFGLDQPSMTVTWTVPAEARGAKAKSASEEKARAKGQATRTQTLRIGAKLPKSELSYANIEGSPAVFTVSDKMLAILSSELHTHQVMAFPKGAARRVVLRWPGTTLAFKPQEIAVGKGVRWVPEGDPEVKGFDVSRIGPLVESLARLNTPRFLQYTGPITAATGLDRPRLIIEVQVGDERAPRVLRIGRASAAESYATNATGADGPVFVLTGPAWFDLATHAPGASGATLPDDVFAPEPGKPAPGDGGPRAPPS